MKFKMKRKMPNLNIVEVNNSHIKEVRAIYYLGVFRDMNLQFLAEI